MCCLTGPVGNIHRTGQLHSVRSRPTSANQRDAQSRLWTALAWAQWQELRARIESLLAHSAEVPAQHVHHVLFGRVGGLRVGQRQFAPQVVAQFVGRV